MPTTSDDASSINHQHPQRSQYVSFNIATYDRRDLLELKNRLLSELDQIRVLKIRIEAGDFKPKKKRPAPVKRSHLGNANLMKECAQILSKVMKHKASWIFKKPVDAVSLKLHDYHDIIKHPMDLGTVKTNLSKNVYATPLEFAADVRLTFENAMRYNPRGHKVYNYADQLRSLFEELFQPLLDKLGDAGGVSDGEEEDQLPTSSWSHVELPVQPPPTRREEPTPMRIDKKMTELVQPPPPAPIPAPAVPLVHSPVRTSSQVRGTSQVVKPLKQPKPKAKDPNKRDMNMEEKHKLGVGLQSLPPEKMDQVVQTIKKRNGHLKQDGDEIELDIEAVDTETLWELDRLVTNYKKMVSKIKRQGLMGNISGSNIASNRANQEKLPVSAKIDVLANEPKRPKKGELVDEDVDIGDDMPMSSFPLVEIEKDVGGNASSNNSSSSSGSSSSGSSSSSDSDSGNSSRSDSDGDNVQS